MARDVEGQQAIIDRAALLEERHVVLAERRRERDERALLEATVRKLRAERKVMHEMLTEAGIRDDVLADGVRTCLIGRLGVALARQR